MAGQGREGSTGTCLKSQKRGRQLAYHDRRQVALHISPVLGEKNKRGRHRRGPIASMVSARFDPEELVASTSQGDRFLGISILLLLPSPSWSLVASSPSIDSSWLPPN